MNLNPSSCWNSILEKTKPHIPTIDLSATCENADIAIYQRPAGRSLKVPEDPDCFSVEDAYVEEDACQSNIVELNRDTPHVSEKADVDVTKSFEDFPGLSFARLDQWDLDQVLQNLIKNELVLQQHGTAEPVETHASGDKDMSHNNIMERILAFSMGQSSKSVSEPVENPDPIRQNIVWNYTLERKEVKWKQFHQESPTIFIDLRCPDPSNKSSGISPKLRSQSKPRAKHNNHQKIPPAKKPGPDMHNESRIVGREVTGKSMLLQKIRDMNRDGNKYSTSTNPADPGYEGGELNVKPPHPAESICSLNSTSVGGQAMHSCTFGRTDARRPKMRSSSNTEQHPVKEPTQQSGHQRRQLKQASQPEEYRQILKQLEIYRPTKSVGQKQPAAERTDVLYDFKSSHLQSFSTLPEYIISKGCVLLIVCLSSPGMVRETAHGKRKLTYQANTKSHIYNTLVTWFLSLVGPDPHRNEHEGLAKVPFWVAGLQQVWTEDGLALHVLAAAHHSHTQKKRDFDIHAAFVRNVCSFLYETSLTDVAHWLPKLKMLLNQEAFPSPIDLPSSTLNSFISATSNKKVIDKTFGLSPGFYWQTVETQERVCKRRETTQELHTEVSFAVGCNRSFLHPLITHYTLQFVVDSGLDVCGLRLLYPPHQFLSDSAGVYQSADDTCQPVFALAVRGAHAFSVLKDFAESLYPLLSKKTDPAFVSPLQSQSREPCRLYSPRLASQVHKELCMWFSGRLQGGTAQNDNQHLNRTVPLSDGVEGSPFNMGRSSAFLCATTKADTLLMVSPAVPPCCYGQVLAVCERRGFGVVGLRQLRLDSKSAALLRLTRQQGTVFCTLPTVSLDQGELELSPQCLVLLLRKENAMHHSVSLPAALMREFKAQNLLSRIHLTNDGVHAVETVLCFHTVPYNSNLFHTFVDCMWTVPDPTGVILSCQKCQSNSDTEQVVILNLCGKDMSHGLSILHRVLTEKPEGEEKRAGFKLLGLKWLPVLTQLQAQELSPYEVGEQLYCSSLASLMSAPALLCALRRRDAFASIKTFLPYDYPGNLSVLMSSTPEVAFRQASLFFETETIKPFHA